MKMLEDLEEVVRLQRESGFTANFNEDWASTQFLRTHHATIRDMAARLEAAERDAARYRWLRDVGLDYNHYMQLKRLEDDGEFAEYIDAAMQETGR